MLINFFRWFRLSSSSKEMYVRTSWMTRRGQQEDISLAAFVFPGEGTRCLLVFRESQNSMKFGHNVPHLIRVWPFCSVLKKHHEDPFSCCQQSSCFPGYCLWCSSNGLCSCWHDTTCIISYFYEGKRVETQ